MKMLYIVASFFQTADSSLSMRVFFQLYEGILLKSFLEQELF